MKIKLSHKSKKFLKDGFVMQFKKKDAKELAMNIASMIQARVPQGKDYHGQSFGNYSKAYREFKDIKGGRGKGSTVNLTWGGSMLGSLAMQKDLSTYSGKTTKLKFLLGPSLAKHINALGGESTLSNNAIGYFIHTGKLGRYGKKHSGPIVQRPPRHWLGLTEKQGKDVGDIFKDIIRRALTRKMNKSN
tara:strand:- start:553 stop:1119 length:567 start_codon:yes stop_codon:yes gene_type:complete